jgi:cytochrome oxidase assembly protein ShyY1
LLVILTNLAVTYNLYEWQRWRAIDKVKQEEIRKVRMKETPTFLSLNNLPTTNTDIKRFDEQYAYRPFELKGYFDHTKEVLVKTQREGEDGFQVITPFFCYTDSEGKSQALLIDRGWITPEWADKRLHYNGAIGPQTIHGIFFKGDSSNKYSRNNESFENKWNVVKPDQIATYLLLDNKDVASKYVVKQIIMNPIEKNAYPLTMNIEDVSNWPVHAQTNLNYSSLWFGATFLNLFGNVFLWFYL